MTTLPERPIEPPQTRWTFPPLGDDSPDDLIAIGADLEPGTLLAAYRAGYFPMPVDRGDVIGWWSPQPRGILEPARFHISRSLRRSIGRFETRIDTAFDQVMAGCADPARPHGWISPAMRKAYGTLHALGWVHSIEVWDDAGLAGGLYGVAIGGFFAGESMFHHRTDASKVALAALVDLMIDRPHALLDIQWLTPHLARLGADEIDRATYLQRLAVALSQPELAWFSPAAGSDG